jgi:uncharacterized membrane protein YcaP (DUF421 family)
MEDIIHTVVRTAISFILLMFLTFFVGKQINSHKNYFNFALSITLGSFIANMGFDINIKFLPMLSSFLTLVVIYYLLTITSFKNKLLRKWISGEPIVIIEKGNILESNMRKIKYSLDDLNRQLRELGIFDIEEVEYALLEVSGNLSVLKKGKYQNVIKNDLSLKNNAALSLPIEIVMDGEVIKKNLTQKYSMNWIKQEFKKRNLNIDDIQYAVIGTNGQLYVDLYKDKLYSPTEKNNS